MTSQMELKDAACKEVDALRVELNHVSQEIWKNPELNYEEVFAHKVLTEFLIKQGFDVEKNYVVKTGFRATKNYGKGPNVVVICEYDALPQIGHACGHNLIAEVGIGAAVGIKRALDTAAASGKQLGQLTVLGTPAEEGGGGKVDMIEAGCLNGVDLAMMCHPGPHNVSNCDDFLAIVEVNVKYIGKASHAAAFPWEGINALDAAVMAYTSISAMRQQIKLDCRVHGVITNGGSKPNIIPELSELSYYIRAPTFTQLNALQEKMMQCFNAAAVATGCQVKIDVVGSTYANLITNPTLKQLYDKNFESLGHKFSADQVASEAGGGSTDMGNVSHVVPSIHPNFYIGSTAFNHTREFTTASGAPEAQLYTLMQAKSLAMTAIDVYTNQELLPVIKQQFNDALQKEQES